MSIKTFTCKVPGCGKEVTKPKSFAYQSGRACKEHPEAIAANEASQNKVTSNLAAHKHAPRPWEKGYKSETDGVDAMNSMFENTRNPHTYCWHCNKNGVYNHIIAQRMLVNISKAEMMGLGKSNPFDPESPHYELIRKELGEVVPLKQFPIAKEYPDWKLKQLVSSRMDIPARMIGSAILCNDCAKEFKFDWNFDLPKFDALTPDAMAFLGFAAKEFGKEVASEELAAEMIQKVK